jgi:hypothetical protein
MPENFGAENLPPVLAPNPFRTIWFQPRRTMREILAEDPRRNVIMLFLVAGAASSLERASDQSAAEGGPMGVIIAFSLTVGPAMVLLLNWILSHTISWTGEWMGGRAEPVAVRAAMAWGYFPTACTLPLWFLLIGLTGNQMFLKEPAIFDEDDPELGPLLGVLAVLLVMLVLRIWSFVTMCHTTAEVQGYKSAWRGLGNLLLGALVLVAPIALLALFFAFARR